MRVVGRPHRAQMYHPLLLLLVLLLSTASLQAVPLTVAKLADWTALNTTLVNAKAGDTFEVSWAANLTAPGTLSIKRGVSLIIQGTGSAELSGGRRRRLFSVSGSLAISDLRLSNGNSSGAAGGAVVATSAQSFSATRCSFVNNQGGNGGAVNGGANLTDVSS